LIRGERTTRNQAIGFLNKGGAEAVWMEDQYKMILKKDGVELYDIPQDEAEEQNLASQLPEVTARMQKELTAWVSGVMQDLKIVTNRR
jgi:hypothetical protein